MVKPPKPEYPDWDRRLAAAVASDPQQAAWLDGGADSLGFFGARPDWSIRSGDLDALDEVERAWRDDPGSLIVGTMTYELGVAALLGRAPRAGGLWARRYRGALRADPSLGLLGDPGVARETREWVLDQDAASLPRPRWPLGPLMHVLTPDDYAQAVARIHGWLRAGESYQINFSHRFVAHAEPDVLGPADMAAAYLYLRRNTPSSMGAFLAGETEGSLILSNSPETLVELELPQGFDGPWLVASEPIKGTRPRGLDRVADQRQIDALVGSEKDAAEHLMIVDLVRSDLGRIAQAGSVRAPRRPRVVTLPTVHHLVSRVEARVACTSLRDVMGALFPGGSVTGAPKIRTCELIERLESEPRGIYCGAIFACYGGRMEVSIPIRTGVLDAAGLIVRSGGGIVMDSNPQAEFAETVVKARAFAGEYGERR